MKKYFDIMNHYGEKMFRRIIVVLAIFSAGSGLFAQDKIDEGKYPALNISGFFDSSHHWYDIYDQQKVIMPKSNQPRYKPNEITKIADNIMLYQKDNGGWPKNYDMFAILNEQQIDTLKSVKKILNTTFDNGTTHTQVEYLAQVYSITKDEKYKDPCMKGLNYIISSQYPNGGWPQFFPDTSGYAKYITFNDGVMVGIMNVLKNIVDNKPHFAFLDDVFREKIKRTYEKGIECILNCQIKEKGKLLAWCQQHDNLNYKPKWARTFEPPSICNGESSGIVLFLMSIENPNKDIIKSIQGAVKWFDDSKILNTKVNTVTLPPVKYKFATSRFDRVVVKDSNALPIWTRFYELKTHKPLFCDRGRKLYYSLDKVSRERRSGYAYYIYDPQTVIDKYPEWQRKWAPDENVLAK